jgi:phage/plasmid-associated DNA primase
LDGVGGASKGAFVGTINGVVGPQNVYELRTKLLAERFEIGRMRARTLLIGSDVKGDFMSSEGAYRLKSLVGGDTLDAEIKGSNHIFVIYGIFNALITANTRLRIWLDEDRSAWERRLLIVRYDSPYTGKRIFEIEKYLLEKEGPGILNWCLEGLKMLFQDYAIAGDIILSPEQKKRVSDLLSESDSLRLFVAGRIVSDMTKTDEDESQSLTTEEIVGAYIKDCLDRQWIPVGYATAEKRLPDLMIQYFGITKSHDLLRPGKKNQRGYWNVRFS